MLSRIFRQSSSIRGMVKKYADCLNYVTRVGFRGIRLVSLGSYRLADLNAVFRSQISSFVDKLLIPTPYSPNLAPYDFFLFPKLKLLKRRFKMISEMKANATNELKGIIKEAYQDRFKKWIRRWDKGVRCG